MLKTFKKWIASLVKGPGHTVVRPRRTGLALEALEERQLLDGALTSVLSINFIPMDSFRTAELPAVQVRSGDLSRSTGDGRVAERVSSENVDQIPIEQFREAADKTAQDISWSDPDQVASCSNNLRPATGNPDTKPAEHIGFSWEPGPPW